ncbi:MAG: hypothetical protein ACYC36_12805 [Bellilinea sp.]
MKLDEFISETLNQIIDGVTIAQEHAKEKGALVAPRNRNLPIQNGLEMQMVEFDVAITVSDSTAGKGGAGIIVAGLTLGGQVSGEISNQTLSHIKFSVSVWLPPQP